jgi:outer membrane immunogenic protein
MKHWLYTIGTVAILASGSAFAADLTHVPAPVPAFTWTGFYVGAQGGYAFGSSAETFYLDPNTVGHDYSQSYNTSGAVFGGVAGANYQMGAVVVGVEAEDNWASVSGSSGVVNTGDGDTYTTKLKWYGAVKGRLGYAVDKALFYVDGGAAFGGTQHAYLAALNGGAANTFIQNSSKSGIIVGAGIEYAFTQNLIGRIAYDYVSLGNSSIHYLAPPSLDYSTWKDHYNVVQVGLTWLFGAPSPAPVVAKY